MVLNYVQLYLLKKRLKRVNHTRRSQSRGKTAAEDRQRLDFMYSVCFVLWCRQKKGKKEERRIEIEKK